MSSGNERSRIESRQCPYIAVAVVVVVSKSDKQNGKQYFRGHYLLSENAIYFCLSYIMRS